MWLKESESGWKGKTIPVWVLLFAASFVPDMRVDYEMVNISKIPIETKKGMPCES